MVNLPILGEERFKDLQETGGTGESEELSYGVIQHILEWSEWCCLGCDTRRLGTRVGGWVGSLF